jgi:hypothetical protein
VETELTDEAGVTTRERIDALRQRYGLSLERSLTDYLAASAGGTLVDERGWRRTNGVWSDAHARSTSLFGRLSLGTPVLTVGLGVDRREQESLSPAAPSAVTESYVADASWRPVGLPELQLRFSRVNTFDSPRRDRDVTTDSAQFATRYRAPRNDVRFLVGWNRAVDHLRGSETSAIEEVVLATRTDELLRGRMSTYLSGTVQGRSTSTSARSAGATVTRQQLPVQGFSGVLAAPTTAEDVQLTPNPLVIDGNVAASAAVNVGFGLAALNDRDAREVGGRFADAVTDVNTIHVWFVPGAGDRGLTPEIARELARTARVLGSDDNQRWTDVTLGPLPAPRPGENRIELKIARSRARHLKVSLQPLPVGITTDVAFRDMFVSEVQFLLVLPIEEVPRRDSTALVSATAIARTMIVRSPELSHDVSASLSRRTDPSLTTYTVVNGLSFRHNLSARVAANARAARQDLDDGGGHEGSWQWNAALTGNPVPAAFWTLAYNGSTSGGDQVSHALSALGRADLYEGISAQANTSGSITTQGLRTTRSFQASGTTSLTPNAYVTLSGGALYSRSVASDPIFGDTLTRFGRVDGSVSITPAPALSAVGTVSRVLVGVRPTTLATMQLNYFPLRGEVQLAVAYSKTLDTQADATTEILSPSLHWTVRSGVSLDASYTLLESDAPAQTLATRAFAARLLVLL